MRCGVAALCALPALAAMLTCVRLPQSRSGRCAGVRAAAASDRFDQVQQKSVHNAYQKEEGLGEQLHRDEVRSLELDLHREKLGAPTVSGDWYVHHLDVFDAETSCRRLSDCLDIVAAFHARRAEHEVLTVFLDFKEPLGSPGDGHDAEQLDARLAKHLPDAARFGPADMLRRCPAATTLRQAVQRCGWPRLSELAGRVIFVLTGGDGCSPDDSLVRYVGRGQAARARAAFVAPSLGGSCTIDDHLRSDHVLMVNMDATRCTLAAQARSRGLLARVWDLEDEEDWDDAAASGANFLVLDKIDAGHLWCGSAGEPASAFARAAR